MNIWQSVRSIVITRPHVPRLTKRRWLLLFLLIVVSAVGLLYISAPSTRLAQAQAHWAEAGYKDYRIVASYKTTLFQCAQDLEVRGGEISYRHQDTCGSTTSSSGFQPLTVSKLFERIQNNLDNPPCGPNGCVCDGPIGIDVIYDAERGYPQQLSYRLMPELRWRDVEYWKARLSGTLACPISLKSGLPYESETIIVTSLTPLKAKDSGAIEAIPLATATP